MIKIQGECQDLLLFERCIDIGQLRLSDWPVEIGTF